VMTVSNRIVRMPHARERPARWTDDGKHKRPERIRLKVKARQLETVSLKRNLMVRQWNGLRSGNRFGGRQHNVGGQTCTAEPENKARKRAGNHETSRAVVEPQANSNFSRDGRSKLR